MAKADEAVLIVDDDETLRGSLSAAVEQLGYSVHAAGDVPAARKWAERRVPRLILIDVMMPEGNGLDFCRWVRSQPRLELVPIVVMTAIRDEHTESDAMELGAADYLRKPFGMKDLKAKLAKYLDPKK